MSFASASPTNRGIQESAETVSQDSADSAVGLAGPAEVA